ncbi:prephenate dehydratase [Rarobacter incanus]|uniref:Prephenate dehydratase n=1 Tax=Rarobacter incanus TaxID=153494 RepID=A0A542SNB3_9MICO|nr:prephenate dehydratase domain-containing protein [Rarobacter incanus]TQK76120.1 prephenate dehydratase [Rarobacter incanus]
MAAVAASGPNATAYLGPEGSFTYAAARHWASPRDLIAADSVPVIVAGIEDGRWSAGVIAIENSVEGYVTPSLDSLIGAGNAVAVDQLDLPIEFDAFVRSGADGVSRVTAHPHGLAQCKNFIRDHHLTPVPASSNAAACRDLDDEAVALGPRICGELYGLTTVATSVQDFAGARTRFLLVTRRDAARERLGTRGAGAGAEPALGWSTMLAITPVVTGPGVLARIAGAFGARGVNMSSLITRPLKALSGKYVFIVTCDGKPGDPPVASLIAQLLDAGDSVKTLGVFPSVEDLQAQVSSDRIPPGSVVAASTAAERTRGLLW